ncbi:MAG: hypothetical protein ACE5HW_06080 [Candidatus Methanofastidiosia archaeon]
MNEISYFILMTFGITEIVTRGKIFKPMRDYFTKISPNILGEQFSCQMCFSFWVGLALSLYMGLTVSKIFLPADFFLMGCLASGVVWFLDNISWSLYNYSRFSERRRKKEFL